MDRDNLDYKIPSLPDPRLETYRRCPGRVSCDVVAWRCLSWTSSTYFSIVSSRATASQMIVVSQALALSVHIVKSYLNLYASAIMCKIIYNIYNSCNGVLKNYETSEDVHISKFNTVKLSSRLLSLCVALIWATQDWKFIGSMNYKPLIQDIKPLIKWKPNSALSNWYCNSIALNYSYLSH